MVEVFLGIEGADERARRAFLHSLYSPPETTVVSTINKAEYGMTLLTALFAPRHTGA